MHFEATLQIQPAEWDEAICALDATHFQAAAWARYKEILTGGQPVFFHCRDNDGTTLAAAIGYVEQSKRIGLQRLSRRLVLDSHPILKTDSAANASAFLKNLENYARRTGCVSITVESFFSGRSQLALRELGFVESPRIEFHFPLQEPIDSLWNRVSKEQREKIRRAEKKGVEVKMLDSLAGLLALRELQATTKERRDEMGQEYDLDSDDRRYRQLSEMLGKGGLLMLFIAYFQGQPISGILFGTFNRRAYSIFSGSNSIGYKLSAPSLLFWRAVQHFHESKYILLNRGGVPYESQEDSHPAHGIYFYKSRLGTEPVVCTGGTKTLRPIHHHLYGLFNRYAAQFFRGKALSVKSTNASN